MGFQDRDYYRESGFQTGSYRQEHSAIFYIIVINVVVWLLDSLLLGGQIEKWCCLRGIDFASPTNWYRFLTYGFCHDLNNIWHIVGNMFTLYFLGCSVEARYGRREFLFFYLISIILGGIYWSGSNYLSVAMSSHELSRMELIRALGVPCVGASGGITAVTILFAMNFPRVTLLIWGLIPMPAFALGILIVIMDLVGTQSAGSNIAHSVHLAGAAFAVIYFLFKIRFCSIFGYGRPKIHAYNSPKTLYKDPDDDYEDDSYGYAAASTPEEELRREEEFRKIEAEVEALLKKISEKGMQCLTPEELARLREASQIYKTRR